jgi:hypothetical protein
MLSRYHQLKTDLIGERGGSGLLELFLVLGNESLVDLDLRGSEGGSGDKLETLVSGSQQNISLEGVAYPTSFRASHRKGFSKLYCESES